MGDCGVCRGVLESETETCQSFLQNVGRRWDGNVQFGGYPSDTFDESSMSRRLDPDLETTVGVERRAQIPTFRCMRSPRFTDGGGDVREDACSWWCQGSAVVIEMAVDLGPCRQAGVDTRSA